jgi:hypothetical protein
VATTPIRQLAGLRISGWFEFITFLSLEVFSVVEKPKRDACLEIEDSEFLV